MKSIPARLTTVEKKLRQKMPEKKYHHGILNNTSIPNGSIVSVTTNDIAEGVASFARVGVNVNILSVEITGYLAPGVDVYLLNPLSNTVPVAAEFSSVLAGAFFMKRFGDTLYHRLSGEDDGDGHFRHTHHFRFPLRMRYEGSVASSATRNRLRLVVFNNSGVTSVAQLNFRVTFIDP